MKNLILAISLAFGVTYVTPTLAAETKEVCKEVVGKDGKPVKDKKGNAVKKCKKIKVHKKVEGEKVPDGKKK